MPFNSFDIQVQDIFNNRVFFIPRNQRKYVWTDTNWRELMSDLQFAVGTDYDHFLGSIVLTTEKNITTNIKGYSIIDGQQRIITSTVILCVIAQLFLERSMQSSFDSIKRLLVKSDIIDSSKTFCVIDKRANASIYYLINKLIEQEANSFILDKEQMLNPLDNNIKQCFLYYYNILVDSIGEDNSKLLKYYEVLLNIRLVSIEATSEEDSYTIFEILNARGVALDDHELLKNFIMRYFTPKENIDEVKDRWTNLENKLGNHLKNYIKYYAIFRYYEENSDKNEPYKIISKNIRDSENITDGICRLLDDLEQKAGLYQQIIDPENPNNSEVEKMIFTFLKKRRQRQYRPLILGLLNAKAEGKINEELYINSLFYLFVFFVSYNIIGEENSNKTQDIIHKYSREFGRNCNIATIAEFKKSIEKKLPEKEHFKTAFQSKGFSSGHHEIFTGSKNADSARIVLGLVEFLDGGQLDLNFDFTIEHIISDKYDKTYLYGNLLPLEEELNQKVKDLPIEKKLPYYKKSRFNITKHFTEIYNESWDILSYTDHIAEKIYHYFESKMNL